MLVGEVGANDGVNHRTRHCGPHALVPAQSLNLIEQISWMHGTERPLTLVIVIRYEVLERGFVKLDAERGTDGAEDLLEFIESWILEVNLVLDPTQESLVSKLGRLEIGGEHHNLVEWNLQLGTGHEGEVIDLRFERNNQPVEQLLWVHCLTSEIVDQEHPAVGLHLIWRLIRPTLLVEVEIKSIRGQLPADDDRGAFDSYPAPVISSDGGRVGMCTTGSKNSMIAPSTSIE